MKAKSLGFICLLVGWLINSFVAFVDSFPFDET